MAFNRILIANRGEIAIRLARAIADCDATSVAVYAEDDAQSLHVRSADQAIALQGHVLGQLPEGEREKFLEQLETIAEACRDISKPQR